MDAESIRILDDVNDLDVIEVHYLVPMGDVRTAVGSYGGLKRCGNEWWWVRLIQKPAIRTMDIQQIRILTPANKGEQP